MILFIFFCFLAQKSRKTAICLSRHPFLLYIKTFRSSSTPPTRLGILPQKKHEPLPILPDRRPCFYKNLKMCILASFHPLIPVSDSTFQRIRTPVSADGIIIFRYSDRQIHSNKIPKSRYCGLFCLKILLQPEIINKKT